MKNRPKIKNSTILVTGGAGFIGSHLVDRLLTEQAKQVIVVDNMFLGDEDNLKDAFKKELFFIRMIVKSILLWNIYLINTTLI